MRGAIPVALPETARTKLQDLQLACEAALDAAHASNARAQALPRDADQLRTRLAAERDKHNARHAQLSRLLNATRQWLMELRPGVALETALQPVIEHKPGTDLNVVINNLRTEIASTKQELQSTRSAPLPKSDAKKLATNYVAGLMRAGKVSVAIQNDQIKLNFRGDMFAPEDTLAMIAQFAPDAVLAALEDMIDALPTRADAMPRLERDRRAAELARRLEEFELAEQTLLDHAHKNGLDMLPRPDTSPSAFLGVVVVKAQAQVA